MPAFGLRAGETRTRRRFFHRNRGRSGRSDERGGRRGGKLFSSRLSETRPRDRDVFYVRGYRSENDCAGILVGSDAQNPRSNLNFYSLAGPIPRSLLRSSKCLCPPAHLNASGLAPRIFIFGNAAQRRLIRLRSRTAKAPFTPSPSASSPRSGNPTGRTGPSFFRRIPRCCRPR